MREKEISHKRAADPPKNSPEMTGPFPSFDESRRRVDAENGSSITANSFPKSELDTLSSTWSTRSHYPSVAKTLSSSSGASEDDSTRESGGRTRIMFMQHSGNAI